MPRNREKPTTGGYPRRRKRDSDVGGWFLRDSPGFWQRVDSPEAINPWFLRDSPGFELASELRVRADEAIFDKISMSAFEGTPLAMALRDCGLISFMICGVIQRRKLRHVKLCSKLCLRFIVSQGLDFVWGINQPSHRGNGRPLGGASSLRADLGCTVR